MAFLLAALAIVVGAAIFAIMRIAQDQVAPPVEGEPRAGVSPARIGESTIPTNDPLVPGIERASKDASTPAQGIATAPAPSEAVSTPPTTIGLPDSNTSDAAPSLPPHEAGNPLPTPNPGTPDVPPVKTPSPRASPSAAPPRVARAPSHSPRPRADAERKPHGGASEAMGGHARTDVARAGLSAEPAAPDRWARMREEMSACAKENLFVRLFCEQRVRFRHCDGYWGVVPQCPGARQSEYTP